ncbi:hypothetical protein Agub_g6608, partial [Astrephomene gubernaculifera]
GEGRFAAVCANTGTCGFRLSLPRAVSEASPTPQPCGSCALTVGAGPLMCVALRFRMGLLPPGVLQEPNLTGCLICDPRIKEVMEACGVGTGGGGTGGGGGGARARGAAGAAVRNG